MREKLIELIQSAVGGCATYWAGLIADHLISNSVTVQEWISVKDRLPRKEEYTAKAKDGTEYYVRLLIAYKTDIVEYEIGYYDGYKWMTEMPIRLIKDVVAWMPFPNLPQPPKGEPIYCKDCEHLMFSDCYGECEKGYKGIVQPNDTCEHARRKPPKGE